MVEEWGARCGGGPAVLEGEVGVFGLGLGRLTETKKCPGPAQARTEMVGLWLSRL